ncbi:AsnC family transcriptional regulator [Candidatus Micrarchaeota archaeon]|nr:AsnC family transcriptional regulator [Candidatus Micrarchaeota archaeon]
MVEIVGIKLDKADRIILAELDKNCRIPMNKLAKITRKSRQSVEYRIIRLVERGIITAFKAAINPHKMGYRIYKLYLQLKNVPEQKQKLLEYLRSSPNVYWLGECDGTWDLVFAVYAKSEYEFYDLKNDLFSKFNEVIVNRYGDALLDVMQYPKMYFTNSITKPTIFGGEIVKNELDQLDYLILQEIVNNAKIPMIELATRVKSTPPTISSRLKRMEELGIIIQYRISVDLDKLGLEMYKAIVHLEKYTKEDEKRLLEYVSGIPNIQYFIRNNWDLEPELVVSNYHEYREITDELRKNFPQVIRNVEAVLMKSDEWTPGFGNMLSNKQEKAKV